MMELLKGKYALDACIGRGGMAEVFAGRTVGAAGFSQRVAIKRILPVHGLEAAFREMFITEAQLSSYLQHDNIVRVFDFDEDEAGRLFLVMEYVDGVDLAGLVGTGLLPLPVVLYIIGEILQGLAYVHELPLIEGGPRGLVHRDISPQNVLVSWGGAVQLSDFGIAKARIATQAGASMLIKGKPAYMSPEQAGGLALDGRSDIFAVGIMLWEMLCGEALFHDPNDMRATLAAVMFGDAPPPSSRSRRPIPDDVERVTMQMLRRVREARHDAATALAALTACADYPRSGRAALAALLPERLPERAPRRGFPRRPRSERSGEPAALQRPADASPYATATPSAVPQVRQGAPIRSHRSVMERARRRGLRRVLLAATTIGALSGAIMHVVLRGSSSAASGAPDVPGADPAPAPGQEALHAAPPPARVDAPPQLRVDAPRPASDAAPLETQARPQQPGRDDASPATRRARSPTSPPAHPPAPARSGMRIIDLRPDTPEAAPTGRAQRGTQQIDLGNAAALGE